MARSWTKEELGRDYTPLQGLEFLIAHFEEVGYPTNMVLVWEEADGSITYFRSSSYLVALGLLEHGQAQLYEENISRSYKES